jgi:hypothetical protein
VGTGANRMVMRVESVDQPQKQKGRNCVWQAA